MNTTIEMLIRITGLLLVGWAGHLLLARFSPRLRVVLWRFVFGCMLLLPLLSVSLPPIQVESPFPSQAAPAPADSPAAALNAPAVLTPVMDIGEAVPVFNAPPSAAAERRGMNIPVLGIAIVVWAVGAALLLARLLLAAVRLRRIVKETAPCPPALAARLDQVSQALGISRPIELRVREGNASPFVAGIVRPVIVPRNSTRQSSTCWGTGGTRTRYGKPSAPSGAFPSAMNWSRNFSPSPTTGASFTITSSTSS
jgi:beta-lactamase regulating signal transducer with metallopeptidase domain